MGGIHLISTSKQTMDEFIKKVKEIHTDVDYIHLREKDWKAKDYVKAINKLVEAGISRQKIIINDRVDIAVTEELLGVQLTMHSLDAFIVKRKFPHLKIGCSVHNIQEARNKAAQGADYLIYGHIFKTDSKVNLPPKGLANLESVVNEIKIPVIAIGGIKPDDVQSVFRTGAKGIAVLSGILLADDVKQASLEYKEKITESEVE